MDENERIAQGKHMTRLHSCPKHPCQLFFLAVRTHPTRKFDVLLGHEIPTLSDLLRGQPNGCCGSKGNEGGFMG